MREINKELNEKCGIYIITNLVNGNRYIGSAKNLGKRLYDHVWDLDKNVHPNNHLQNAWNKYKKDNFEYGILEYCNTDVRLSREKYYIDIVNPEYNINGVNLEAVTEHSDETKRKISDTVKKCYINGKLDSIHCYIYSIKTWKLIKECISINEASEYLGMKQSVRTNIIEHRLFKNEFIVRLNKAESKLELMNDVCKNILTYQSQNDKRPEYTQNPNKYLIGERDGVRNYFRNCSDLVSFFGVSSKSTLMKHRDATREKPFVPRNTNIQIYWSKEFIPYRPSIDEKSNGLRQGNIGEDCDVNTEITEEIKKSSVS